MKTRCRRVCLSCDDSIRKALETINREASRVVLVVDSNDHLLGVVTDGDIRRGILCGVPLHCSIKEVMNQKPIVFATTDSKELIKQRLDDEKLLHAPIIKAGKLHDLVTMHDLVEKPKFDNPVFLMAGGFGKRLMPLTKDCPKPLLKVGNKPLLETTLENFIQAGFHRFFISTHYLSDKVRDYFGNGEKWHVSIEYIHENEPLGTAGALGLLEKELIHGLPVIVMNGDILTKVDFEQLMVYHNYQADALATMCVRECQYQIPYGVISTDGENIVAMQEKPVQRFLVNAGIYVVTPELIDQVGKNEHIDMPTLLSNQLAENHKVAMFPIHEYWLDIGKRDDFQRAQMEFAQEFCA